MEKAAGVKAESLKLQKDKLEREQRKLLQAHYSDAIPLNLLKEEQDRISRSLKNINNQIVAYQEEYSKTSDCLNGIFELLENCGKTYEVASDFERRCFNQALFEKILVYDDLRIDVEYTEPFIVH